MKVNYLFEKTKNIFKSQPFIIVYMGILLLNIIALIDDVERSYFESLLWCPHYYYNYILFLILAYSTYEVSKNYSKSFVMITRYDDKRQYLNNLIKVNTFVSATSIMISFMITFILFSIKYIEDYKVINFIYSEINIVIYYIFFVIRYIIISLLINNIFLLFTKNIGTTLSALLSSIIVFLMYGPVYKAAIVESFKDVTLLPGYFLSIKAYSNFGLEVSASLLMILILLIINVLLYTITIKRKNNNFLIS